MRILFMGTPEFAVPALEAIVESEHQVVGVVTAPDRPAGRGKKMTSSAVKRCAEAHQLPIYQPERLKDEEFVESMRALKPDLAVVIAFRMLPRMIWEIPTYGTFNIHGSLLPAYRGAAPIQWAVINGEKKTGLTSFFIDEKLDTGAIIDSVEVAIGPNETAGELHDKLMPLSAALTLTTIEAIARGGITAMPQREVEENWRREAPKLNRDNTSIRAERSTVEVTRNLIRGLAPFPGAHQTYEMNGEQLFIKFFGAEVEQNSDEGDFADAKSGVYSDEFQVGDLWISESQILLKCTDGILRITELQFPGKKRMETAVLLKGWRKTGIWRAIINNSV